jgi:hypothetical protein
LAAWSRHGQRPPGTGPPCSPTHLKLVFHSHVTSKAFYTVRNPALLVPIPTRLPDADSRDDPALVEPFKQKTGVLEKGKQRVIL